MRMPTTLVLPQIIPVPIIPNVIQQANLDTPHNIIQPAHPIQIPNALHVIADDEESIVNVFCFGAFEDKRNGVVYNDLKGGFLFMSLEESLCFFRNVSLRGKRDTGNPFCGP